jgi:hypothetical protein
MMILPGIGLIGQQGSTQTLFVDGTPIERP